MEIVYSTRWFIAQLWIVSDDHSVCFSWKHIFGNEYTMPINLIKELFTCVDSINVLWNWIHLPNNRLSTWNANDGSGSCTRKDYRESMCQMLTIACTS